jgi:hypothetical protein
VDMAFREHHSTFTSNGVNERPFCMETGALGRPGKAAHLVRAVLLKLGVKTFMVSGERLDNLCARRRPHVELNSASIVILNVPNQGHGRRQPPAIIRAKPDLNA